MNIVALAIRAATCAALVLASGCDTATPTSVEVVNAYARQKDRSAFVVVDTWWSTTLFDDPLLIGDASDAARTVPGDDYAYAVLAGNSVRGFVALRSKEKLSVARGDTLHIEVSDATFDGRCAGGSAPLTQHEADFITQRIFPETFSGVRYEAATCYGAPPPRDAGEENDGGD